MKKNPIPFIGTALVLVIAGILAIIPFVRSSSREAALESITDRGSGFVLDRVVGIGASRWQDRSGDSAGTGAQDDLSQAADTAEASDGADAAAGEAAAEMPPVGVDYFQLVTQNRITILRLRETPSLSAKILYKMSPSTHAFVVYRGNLWSLIVAETPDGLKTGYAFNGFLYFDRIDKSEIPEEVLAIPVPDPPLTEDTEVPFYFVGNPYGNDVDSDEPYTPPIDTRDPGNENAKNSASSGNGNSGSGSGSSSGDTIPASATGTSVAADTGSAVTSGSSVASGTAVATGTAATSSGTASATTNTSANADMPAEVQKAFAEAQTTHKDRDDAEQSDELDAIRALPQDEVTILPVPPDAPETATGTSVTTGSSSR